MSRVIHFEIGAADPERARKFYTEVFGWKVWRWGGPHDYWLAETGPKELPGIDGAIVRRDSNLTNTVNTIGVESVDQAAAKIAAAGGKILVGKTEVPGVGFLVYCQDTEGNTFGIMEPLQPDAA